MEPCLVQNKGKDPKCQQCPNKEACLSGQIAANDAEQLSKIKLNLSKIKNIVLVLSGKGGVGLLDIDICGPSIPRLLGLDNESVHQSSLGWEPVSYSDNLDVISCGFLIDDKSHPIIWKGPRKQSLIAQFLQEVRWGELDYLVIDCPPGTSDEQITICNMLAGSNLLGAIVVTTAQEISLLDVRKCISFCKKANVRIIGVVENMSYFLCPHCTNKEILFEGTTGGTELLCKETGTQLICKMIFDKNMNICADKGVNYISKYPESEGVKTFMQIAEVVKNVK